MAATEVRTQIYLPKRLHRALGETARRRGVSMAQLLREGAETLLARATEEVSDPFGNLIGAVKSGPPDVSERHDEYLQRRRTRRKR